jgi:hypothetical protein
VIVKAKNPIALAGEKGVATRVTPGLAGLKVLAAVKFNDQLRCMADKVGDIGTDGCLAAETRAIQAVSSHAAPDISFCVC